jgi:hypothetical protein
MNRPTTIKGWLGLPLALLAGIFFMGLSVIVLFVFALEEYLNGKEGE